jgi:hypothetical protein
MNLNFVHILFPISLLGMHVPYTKLCVGPPIWVAFPPAMGHIVKCIQKLYKMGISVKFVPLGSKIYKIDPFIRYNAFEFFQKSPL